MLNDINTSSYHTPIMLPQVLSLLRPERGGTYVDGTLGGGGHSLGILRSLPAGGRLFGIDRDGEAIAEASARLSVFPNFVPSAFLIGGHVRPKASPPVLRRISSVPVVMLPH